MMVFVKVVFIQQPWALRQLEINIQSVGSQCTGQAGPETRLSEILNERPQPLACTIVAWVQDSGSVSELLRLPDRFLLAYRKKAPTSLDLRPSEEQHTHVVYLYQTHIHSSLQTSVDPCKNSTTHSTHGKLRLRSHTTPPNPSVAYIKLSMLDILVDSIFHIYSRNEGTCICALTERICIVLL